jgi:hypothetical protein
MSSNAPAIAPNRVNKTELHRLGFGVHRDDFTIRDDLGRRQVVETIGELVAKDEAPMVVGLHGDWGAGKTSALRAIRYNLTGENLFNEAILDEDLSRGQYDQHVVTIWFEAWRYQNEPTPVVALIQEMRRQLSLWHKAKAETGKLGVVVVESLLDSLGKAAKLIGLESLPVSPKDIRASGERYERERLEQALPTDSIQEFLEQAITGLLPDPKPGLSRPRVVVFIDDLDRCNAESAYRLLEGLKIYLQLPNCVFVLGMNQQIVVEAIAERLKKDDNDRTVLTRAEAYLEKLCSNIWRLPLPGDPVTYFASLVDEGDSQESIRQAIGACPRFLPPNPRRLRALANTFNRLRRGAANLTDDFTTDRHLRLLVVAYVYQFHGELFQRWHYDPNFLLSLRDWLRTGPVSTPAATPLPGTAPVPEIAAADAFARLALPTRVLVNATNPTPGTSIESRYPDPSAAGVFWIAPLLQTTLAGATPEEFRRLLTLVS